MAIFNKKSPSQADQSVKAVPVVKDDKSMKDLYATTAVKTDKNAKNKGVISKHTRAYRVLVKPLITEKGTQLASLGKYLFVVENKTNKIEVAKAIEDLYGVKPLKVNMVLMEGKTKVRGRIIGKRKDWKKAIVTVPKGKTLDVYEGI
jgi:large subunit ribosomal protein L23